MIKICLYTILIITLTNTSWGQRSLVGRYSSLGPHGKDIVLNSDSTFEYYSHSDLPDKDGKREYREFQNPMATWTVRGNRILFTLPDGNKDKGYDLELEILNDNIIKQKDSNQKWYKTKVFDDNGELKIEFVGLNVDDKDNYISYIYYEHSGKRTIQYEMRNGVKQNAEMHFFENDKGQKIVSIWGEWNKGLKTGIWTYTNDEGQLTEEQIWKDGKEDGKWNYYTNGQLRTIKVFKNGVLKSKRDI